jgi:hypothetical protein
MNRLLVGCLALVAGTATYASPPVTGNWVIQDRTAVIAINHCRSGLCGRIAKALVIKPNYPKTDVHNPNRALRRRPLIGLHPARVRAQIGSVGQRRDLRSGKWQVLQVGPAAEPGWIIKGQRVCACLLSITALDAQLVMHRKASRDIEKASTVMGTE